MLCLQVILRESSSADQLTTGTKSLSLKIHHMQSILHHMQMKTVEKLKTHYKIILELWLIYKIS